MKHTNAQQAAVQKCPEGSNTQQLLSAGRSSSSIATAPAPPLLCALQIQLTCRLHHHQQAHC
jgi:hypothetical protein